MTLAFHTSKTSEHGTPRDILDSAWHVMGAIDLDPASNAFHNQHVGALRYYTAQDDGLTKEWHGRVLVNPPGDRRGKLVKEFWAKLVWEYYHKRVVEAVWVGFSLEQLVSLQRLEGCRHPLQWPTCIPSRRLKFGGDSPTHGNYITYLGPNESRFVDEFLKYGLVVWPTESSCLIGKNTRTGFLAG